LKNGTISNGSDGSGLGSSQEEEEEEEEEQQALT
jgi:hypothetical protein